MVRDELGSKGYEEYVKTSLLISDNSVKSMDDITKTALEVDGTIQDKLKNLFFIQAFLGLVDAELGGFIKSTGMAIEANGFKDPKEVYKHIGAVDELTDDVISLVSLAGLKFGYDFKHGN